MNNQFNRSSGNVYQGANQASLQRHKSNNKFKSDGWVTFLQARDLGLKIIKGSKAVGVFKGFSSVSELDKKGKVKSTSVPLGFAKVFNIDQTEKFEAKK